MKSIIIVKILLILQLLIFNSLSFSQTQHWIIVYNSNQYTFQWPTTMIFDKYGNVLIGGDGSGLGSSCDYLVSKFDQLGNLVWSAHYNPTGDCYNETNGLTIDNNNNVYATGTEGTVKFSAGGNRIWSDYDGLMYMKRICYFNGGIIVTGATDWYGGDYKTIKYDTSGNKIWTRIYSVLGHANDMANGLGADSTGNIYVGGNSTLINRPAILLKYNNNGDLIWAKNLFSNIYTFTDIKIWKGYIYIVGSYAEYIQGTYYSYFLTSKCDLNGDSVWVRRYANVLNELPKAFCIDQNDNVYVTGESHIYYNDDIDYLTIKYNRDGVLKWFKIYSGLVNRQDIPHAITVDRNNDVIVTGESDTLRSPGFQTNVLTIKYDSSGNVIWYKRNTLSAGSEWGVSLLADSLNGIYIGSHYLKGYPENETDIGLLKYQSNGSQEYYKIYRRTEFSKDFSNCLIVDQNENVFVSGYGGGFDSNYDFISIKYLPNATQRWAVNYNGTGNQDDYICSNAFDSSCNYYVTGKSFESASNYDITTIKYDSSGFKVWVSKYNGPANSIDIPCKIGADNLGNLFVAGTSLGNTGNYDFVLIKYNSSGVQQWVRRYNGISDSIDSLSSMAIDKFGDIIITGKSLNNTNYDFVTVKYSNSGTQQWVETYNSSYNNEDIPAWLALDDSNNIIITGKSFSSTNDFDFLTVKYSPQGTLRWLERYNGIANGTDIPTCVRCDKSNNVYVTGYSWGGSSNFNFQTLKYSTNGMLLWGKVYNGMSDGLDVPNCLAIDGNSNVFVTGTGNFWVSGQDFVTIKYDSLGNETAFSQYFNMGDEVSETIFIDRSGNVYITGPTDKGADDFDVITIKYTNNLITYAEEFGIQTINSFSLSQNYPNPFNPVTKIKYQIPLLRGVSAGRGVLVQLIIYDILGRELQTLVNETQKPGSYEVQWDGSRYASGVYFYKLMTDDYVETKKMVLIK